MMTAESMVGRRSNLYREEIDVKKSNLFWKIVGRNQPDPHAFPIYSTRFRQGEFELMDSFGISLAQVLHGEQSYVFELPEGHLTCGSRVEFETEVSQAFEKKGGAGAMLFLIFSTQVFESKAGKRGTRLMTCRSTMIIRKSTEGVKV